MTYRIGMFLWYAPRSPLIKGGPGGTYNRNTDLQTPIVCLGFALYESQTAPVTAVIFSNVASLGSLVPLHFG
jgi:hypothetical protein